jgi:hypothetical protein
LDRSRKARQAESKLFDEDAPENGTKEATKIGRVNNDLSLEQAGFGNKSDSFNQKKKLPEDPSHAFPHPKTATTLYPSKFAPVRR